MEIEIEFMALKIIKNFEIVALFIKKKNTFPIPVEGNECRKRGSVKAPRDQLYAFMVQIKGESIF